jgi:hypothetical protein
MGKNESVYAHIIHFLHHLGIKAAANRLSVQHPPDLPILVDAASFSYSGVVIQHPCKEGHNLFFVGLYK